MSARDISARLSIIPFILILILSGCSGGSREERAFATISKDFIAYYMKMNPTYATYVGEHRYDDRLDDMSGEHIESFLRSCRDYRERLRAIDRNKLSRAHAVDADYLAQNIDLMIFEIDEEENYKRNPMHYTEILAHSIYGILIRQSDPLEERLDHVADRLEQYPRFVEQAIANLENPPKLRTETAIEITKGLIAFIDGDLHRTVEQMETKSQSMEGALATARGALVRYQDFLEQDLVNRSFGDIRIGDRLYRKRFMLMLGTGMTPEEMVEEAYREIDEMHSRMFVLAAPLYEKITGKSVPHDPGIDERGRIIATVLDDIANDHPKPKGLLDACKAAYDEAEAFVRERDIIELPRQRLRIDIAPPFLQVTQVAASVAPGPLDENDDYYFLVSPVPDYLGAESIESYLREYNHHMIRVITIHEAMPGHFVQFAYSNRYPSLVRTVFMNPSFVEGWAVYCQNMMAAEGFHGNDPRFRLTADKYYLRVVINAVLDSGMHRDNMQEDEAVRFITQEGFQDASEALTKWRRRVGIYPCYLSSYFVGVREIQSIRDEAERQWGEDFDLKKFHEKLIGQGSISPTYVRELVLGSS